MLLLYTGVRVSELCQIKISFVVNANIDAAKVFVPTADTKVEDEKMFLKVWL